MAMNLAGFAVAMALILSGIWIAEQMAQLRREQDCVLMNLKSCRQVAARPGEPHR